MFLRTIITVTAAAGVLAAASLASQTASGSAATGSSLTIQSAGTAPAAAAPVAKAAVELKAGVYTNRLADAMNDIRRKHHLVPFKVRPCLDGFALRWARHLARTGKFEHQRLTPILRDCSLSRVGEILAKGNVSPRYMIRMWLNSPGHRALLLDPRFRRAGVSARRGADGAWVGCIDFGRG